MLITLPLKTKLSLNLEIFDLRLQIDLDVPLRHSLLRLATLTNYYLQNQQPEVSIQIGVLKKVFSSASGLPTLLKRSSDTGVFL